jgi:hypothetical protein
MRAGLPTTTLAAGTSCATTACADHALVTYGHAWKNDSPTSDPYIVPMWIGRAYSQAGLPDARFKWMRRGIDLYGWSHL